MDDKKIRARFSILSDATGCSIAEMCAVFADLYLDCDKCPLKEKCQNIKDKDCGEIWVNFLNSNIGGSK